MASFDQVAVKPRIAAQAVDLADIAATLTPFSSFNVGTVLVQGGVVIAVLLAFNNRLARPFDGADET